MTTAARVQVATPAPATPAAPEPGARAALLQSAELARSAEGCARTLLLILTGRLPASGESFPPRG